MRRKVSIVVHQSYTTLELSWSQKTCSMPHADSLYRKCLHPALGTTPSAVVKWLDTTRWSRVQFLAAAVNAGWVTGKPSQYFTEPHRPTQPPTLRGTENEYRPKCDDALWLGVKAGWLIPYVWMAGKAVWSFVNTCQPERFSDEYRVHYNALYKRPLYLPPPPWTGYTVFKLFFRERHVQMCTFVIYCLLTLNSWLSLQFQFLADSMSQTPLPMALVLNPLGNFYPSIPAPRPSHQTLWQKAGYCQLMDNDMLMC